MPRKPFLCDPLSPYHLSARSNNRDWFFLPIEEVWEIYERYLYFIHHAYEVKVHSFVLMSNHFHLIASFPKANLSEAILYFMRETSRSIARDSDRINHVYGSRTFRSHIGSFHYFQNAYKYIYQNPVRALICTNVEDYRFSTLNPKFGRTRTLIPLEEDTLLFGDPERTLAWLNSKVSKEDYEAVRLALRRPSFKFARCKRTKRAHRLEKDLI